MSNHPDAKPSGFPAIAVDYIEATRSPGRDWMRAYRAQSGRLVRRRIRLLLSSARKTQEARR